MNRYYPYPMSHPHWAGHHHYHGYPHPQMMSPYYSQMATQTTPAQQHNTSLMGSSFVKGALIGAAAAYILSNEQVQQSAIKSAVKTWSLVQGGIEEMKERFLDAEAELHAAQMEAED